MNNSYKKPVVLMNEELAEGVYAASGNSSGCFTVDAYIDQVPETGRDYYVIKWDAKHAATDHHSAEQILTIHFNQTVSHYVNPWWTDPNDPYYSGDGTTTLQWKWNYHQNKSDNIGAAALNVVSAAGLAITGVSLSCDEKCAYNHPLND